MKRNFYLGTALLLCINQLVTAAPVVLTGKTVRFILDDAQLTAYDGKQPTVEEDTLIFAPSTTTYKAEALAPDKAVGFKSQSLDFKIEALGGHALKALTLQTGGSSTVQGKALFTKALAYGNVNVKDQLLVNRSVDFSNVEKTVGGWDGLNVSADPKGTEATVQGITSRTLEVVSTHNMRTLALDATGNAAINAQTGVSFKAATAELPKPERLFNWAESLLPILGGSAATGILADSANQQCNKAGEACKNLDGLSYRCYPAAKLCYGIKDDVAYVYDFSDQIIRMIGATQIYFSQAVKSGF